MTKGIVGATGVNGGLVEVAEGGTAQLSPLVLTDDDVYIRGTPPDEFEYESENPSVATVSASGLVTGVAAGQSTRIFVHYTELVPADSGNEGEIVTQTFGDILDVTVHEQGWGPTPGPMPQPGGWATAEDIALGKRAVVNGVQVTGTAQAYTEGHTIVIPQAFVRAEAAEEE